MDKKLKRKAEKLSSILRESMRINGDPIRKRSTAAPSKSPPNAGFSLPAATKGPRP